MNVQPNNNWTIRSPLVAKREPDSFEKQSLIKKSDDIITIINPDNSLNLGFKTLKPTQNFVIKSPLVKINPPQNQ